MSRACRSPMRAARRSRASRSRSGRARFSASSARTAPARRPSSSAWPACCRRARACCCRTIAWSRRGRAGPLLFYLPDAIAPWPAQPVGWALDFTIGFFGGRRTLRDEVIEQPGARAAARTCRIGTLSKGERKRALLAIGLLTPQPILLVDEPFDGLDLRQSREMVATLRASRRGRPHAGAVDPPDRRGRARLRPVRAAERGTRRAARARSTSSRPGRPLARRSRRARRDLEEVFLALT